MFLEIYDLDYEIEKLADKETASLAETHDTEDAFRVMLSNLDCSLRQDATDWFDLKIESRILK